MDREVFEALKELRALNRAFVRAIHEVNDRLKVIEEWVGSTQAGALDDWTSEWPDEL